MYMLAWEKGLKTTYYLRTVGAGGVEQSTVDINRRGIQPRWMRSRSASSDVMVSRDAPVPSSARSAAAVVTEVIASASGATMDSALPPRAITDAMDSALSPRVTTDSAPLPRAACNLDGDCESCQ